MRKRGPRLTHRAGTDHQPDEQGFPHRELPCAERRTDGGARSSDAAELQSEEGANDAFLQDDSDRVPHIYDKLKNPLF
jgi:hypothetical protein